MRYEDRDWINRPYRAEVRNTFPMHVRNGEGSHTQDGPGRENESRESDRAFHGADMRPDR